jgi:osmotically-inducible protein OsmY
MRAAPALILAFAASSLTGGCVAAAVAGAAGATLLVAKDRTLGEGVDETTGGAEVRTRLLGADFGTFSRVSVEMSRGRLLLAGFVPTMEHKIEAERIAWTVASVQAVENNLEVGPRPDLWRGGWDAWISAEIRTRLVADDDIKGINFNVETHRGVVYLMGVARKEGELLKAVEIARRIRGVEKVVSYVEVRPADPSSRALAFSGAPLPEHLEAPRDGFGPSPAYAADLEMSEPSVIAPPPAAPAQKSGVGGRTEVRYPDEVGARYLGAPPSPDAEVMRRTGSQGKDATGVRGLGRDWSTPQVVGAPLTTPRR